MRAYTTSSFDLTPTAKSSIRIGNRSQIVIGAEPNPLSLFTTKTELMALMLVLHDVLAAMPDDDEVTL
jgi:hypothetical protein